MQVFERQEQIKSIILEQKSVSVSDLTARFNVSFETIRRDLKILEDQGVIEKSYGVAKLRLLVSNTADFDILSKVMVDSKRKIASLARNFITPGDCIYIDFSTTCAQLAGLLEDTTITVLTNSFPVMSELSNKPGVTFFSTGGCWDPRNRAFTGRAAVDTLSQYHVDKAFISCRALSMENGLSDKTEAESDIRRRIIESANEVYLLVDHSKFGKITFIKTSGFERITAIITDKPLAEQWASFLDDRAILHYDCEHTYSFESAE